MNLSFAFSRNKPPAGAGHEVLHAAPDAVPNAAPNDAQHEALQAALAPEVRERLKHLFRATLKEGCIHPLYLPVLRYRSARSAR